PDGGQPAVGARRCAGTHPRSAARAAFPGTADPAPPQRRIARAATVACPVSKGRERAHRTGRAPGRRGEREPGTAPTLGHPGRYGTVRAPISYILRGAVET